MEENIKRIFGEEVDMTGIRNPYQLYRRMRPYYFSDSTSVLKMSKDQFGYFMSQLSADMKQDLFEDFTRQLVIRLITPNIKPGTGPNGHGDGGTDFETYSVSDEISKIWIVADGGCRDNEKWAFAVSCTSNWEQKIERDVKKIASLNRGFTRVFFCTNQKIPSRKQATLYTSLREKYSIEVTILDYNWYEQAVFENGCYNIAISALNLDKNLEAEIEEGPNDKIHRKQLKDIDDKIASLSNIQHLNTEYVDDLLEAAILERTISDGSNRAKVNVKMRFNNALAEAEKHGLSQQIFNIRYQLAWTEFYWNENPDAMIEQYEKIKTLLLDEVNPIRIEKATNLSNLMYTAIAAHLINHDVDTHSDQQYWDDLYHSLENDKEHSSSFLYLRIVRLERQIIETVNNEEDVDDLLIELKNTLAESDHHLDISFESHMTILSAIGDLIAFNPVYDEVVDQLAEIQARRKSEIVAADTHYTRGLQNIDKGNYQYAIKHLGQCIAAYQKEPTRSNLVQACGMLAHAYSRLDLLLCAKVFYIKSLSLLVHKMNVEGQTDHLLVSIMYELSILDIRLGQVNDCLFWLSQMDLIISMCPHFKDDRYFQNRLMLDAMLASALINTEPETQGLQYLPSILENKALFVSRDTLLYRLGYEDAVGEDFRKIIMADDDWEKKLQSKAAEASMLQPLTIAEVKQTTIRTTVRGCTISATFHSTMYSYALAELCLATVEAFMATMQLEDISMSYPTIDVIVKEKTSGKTEVKKGTKSNEHILKINRKAMNPEEEWNIALTLLGTILAKNCVSNDFVELNRKKDSEEKLGLRLSVMCSHSFDFKNTVLQNYPTQIKSWLTPESQLYPNKNVHAQRSSSQYVGKQNENIITDLIDFPLWDKAQWSGCGYIIDRKMQEPPIMILLYKNIMYGKKIFERWEQDFINKKLNLQIVIITGVDATHPNWYKVLISPDMHKTLSDDDIKHNRYVVAASRFHLMQARDDLNIKYLKASYSVKRMVGITAVGMESDYQMSYNPEKRYPKVIPVTNLLFREAWTIGINDVASMAILAGDKPVIPEGHEADAPVLELLKKKQNYGSNNRQ